MRVVVLLTLTVSSLAAAQAVPTIGAGNDGAGEKLPYRGTSVSYGHSASVFTFAPGAQPYYNPTWSQRLGLMPEWHFNDHLFVRSRFFLSQELTVSDWTNTRYEIELSDLWLDGAWAGWKEKFTGIRVAGDLRVMLPTSKASQAMSRLFTLGPSLNLSRTFKVLSGLTLAYATRFTYRFNRFATRQNLGPRITNCGDPRLPECLELYNTGSRNSQYDLLHGPTVVFLPHQRVTIAATFLMQRAWLMPLSTPAEFADAQLLQDQGPNVRDALAFSLGVTYAPWDAVSFTLGAFTFEPQLGLDGRYQFPLFNRNTVVSLDATFDLEGAVSSLTKEKK